MAMESKMRMRMASEKYDVTSEPLSNPLAGTNIRILPHYLPHFFAVVPKRGDL